MSGVLSQFRRLYSHYPGIEETAWDLHPYVLPVDGAPREFFTIGHLGAAINRAPGTIRYWESKRFFPKPSFTVNGADKYKRRRLYTRAQIEGVIRIAQEEGLLNHSRRYLGQTRFTERCFELFATERTLPPPVTENKENT